MSRHLWILIILFLFLNVFAQASVTVKHREVAGDNKYIRADIQLINGSQAINLSNYDIDYFIYEEGLDVNKLFCEIWSFSNGVNTDVAVKFSAYDPPFVAAAKKANIRCHIHFNGNKSIAANAIVNLSIGIKTVDWYLFNKTQHYSYSGAIEYTLNPYIVVQTSNGVAFGILPGTSSTPGVKVAMQWIGESSTIPVNPEAGYVYLNTTDNVAYLYSNSKWIAISNSFWKKTLTGISYTEGTVATSTLTSDNVEVKNVVATPRWKMKIPDYVFDDNYQLESLNEVESYVQKYKHLKDIPSAAEIEKNGVDLAHFNMLLLKKIEELTLQVIELDKKVQNVADGASESKNVSGK